MYTNIKKGIAMEQKTLFVKFMSNFELTYGQQKLNTMQCVATKSGQLLEMLLYHNETGISRESLLAGLYQNEDTDTANSFKALVFRLRRKLGQMGLPQDECIAINDGLYYFSTTIPIKADTDAFRDEIRRADAAEDEKTRAEHDAAACDAYGGEFLPFHSQQTWVVLINAKLSGDYLNAAHRLCEYYKKRHDHEAICELCKRVNMFHPFDEEWYARRLNALIALGKYRQALDEYEAITSMLFDEIGVYPSERLMDCARVISSEVIFPVAAGQSVSAMLKDAKSMGAYYCSYPSFADSYRVLKRIMDRDGIASCLLICTLTDTSGRPLEDRERITPTIQKLSLALGATLRKSDMYTRYSSAQMLVMLWGSEPDNVSIVTDRIDALLAQQDMLSGVRVAFTVLAGDDGQEFILSSAANAQGGRKWHKMRPENK